LSALSTDNEGLLILSLARVMAVQAMAKAALSLKSLPSR
jgi:hypothetical protein